MRKFELETGKTGQWHTWDLRLITDDGEDTLPLFMRSDEVDRIVSEIECTLMTLMNRCKHLSHECMGERIKQSIREALPRTCKLREWIDV